MIWRITLTNRAGNEVYYEFPDQPTAVGFLVMRICDGIYVKFVIESMVKSKS